GLSPPGAAAVFFCLWYSADLQLVQVAPAPRHQPLAALADQGPEPGLDRRQVAWLDHVARGVALAHAADPGAELDNDRADPPGLGPELAGEQVEADTDGRVVPRNLGVSVHTSPLRFSTPIVPRTQSSKVQVTRPGCQGKSGTQAVVRT